MISASESHRQKASRGLAHESFATAEPARKATAERRTAEERIFVCLNYDACWVEGGLDRVA